MGATPINATKRFFAPEITQIIFCGTLADYNNPTRSEIDGGKRLEKECSAVNGFTVESNFIDAPDYGSKFTGQNAGRTQAQNSSLTFYQSQDTDDIRRDLPRGTTGYVLILWGGDVPGQMMDVFPVEVGSAGKSIPDNADADITIQFGITRVPAEDVAIPAAA
jgi:hypothetical protein